jgi:leucyl/phenylalanyl-tRNA--protein transferase
MTTGVVHSGKSKLYWVADNILADDFPEVGSALRDPNGLLAIGGDLNAERLVNAYQHGIFPWFNAGQPILWWSPDPRCILVPDKLKISRSLKKILRKNKFSVTFNQSFRQVLEACAAPRKGIEETWITREMMDAYLELHQSGYAHSVECWHEGKLAGGLYGVAIDQIFFGESMFSRESNASKVALVHLVQQVKKQKFRLIDCQVHSHHLQNLGAEPMPRDMYINILRYYCNLNKTNDWPTESIYQ